MIGIEETLETRGGPRPAVVMTPDTHVVVGRERLEDLRETGAGSALDHQVLDACRTSRVEPRIVIFRGQNDEGTGSWGFDESLSDAEVEELGYFLVRSQLPTYRRLVTTGILCLMHVEFGFREVDSLRDGTTRLLTEAERQAESGEGTPGTRAALHRLDQWILRHMTFFFSVSYAGVLRNTLPGTLPMIEARAPMLQELLTAIPEDPG